MLEEFNINGQFDVLMISLLFLLAIIVGGAYLVSLFDLWEKSTKKDDEDE